MKGHDAKSLKGCQITQANFDPEKIADKCANIEGIPSRRWIQLYPNNVEVSPKYLLGAPKTESPQTPDPHYKISP